MPSFSTGAHWAFMWKADAHLEWDALGVQKLQMEGYVPILRLGQLGGGVGRPPAPSTSTGTTWRRKTASDQYFDWDALDQPADEKAKAWMLQEVRRGEYLGRFSL